MRVVLDADVYVSALLTQQGNARKIMDLVEEEKLNLLISEPVLVEVERVLGDGCPEPGTPPGSR